MDLKISPSNLEGNLRIPSSKSVAHRAIICAALANNDVILSSLDLSDDIIATLEAMRVFGKRIERDENQFFFSENITFVEKNRVTIDCRESGSTARFLIPIAAVLGKSATFIGRGQLPYRHFKPIIDVLKVHGVEVSSEDSLPLTIHGKLTGTQFNIPGDLSSQFVTGLLFALPLLPNDSYLNLTTELSSKPYVNITLQVLKNFGITICPIKQGYFIRGNQQYQKKEYTIESDYSNAAFYMAASAIGNKAVALQGLNPSSVQGDKEVISILEQFGAQVTLEQGALILNRKALTAMTIDAANIPDLVPILAVVASYAKGTTLIKHVARLRSKESDRLLAISDGLNQMGGHVTVMEDQLFIDGVGQLEGNASVSSYEDHRIAMALSIAASYAKHPCIIRGAECVKKSYPTFYQDFKSLGGICDVINVGQ